MIPKLYISRNWLDDRSPCEGGGAWGRAFLGEKKKSYRECLESIGSPDWFLWLVGQAQGQAEIAELLERRSIGETAAPEGWNARPLFDNIPELRESVKTFGDCSFAALLMGDTAKGYAYQFHGFRCAFLVSWLTHEGLEASLKHAQAAANALVRSEIGAEDLNTDAGRKIGKALCHRMWGYLLDERTTKSVSA